MRPYQSRYERQAKPYKVGAPMPMPKPKVKGSKVDKETYDLCHRVWRAGIIDDWYFGKRSPESPHSMEATCRASRMPRMTVCTTNGEGSSSPFSSQMMVGSWSVTTWASGSRIGLTELCEETCPGSREGASFVCDLLGAALSEVDWYEIADVWLDDARETMASL